MGITTSNKTISTNKIECDGTLKITLAISAAPDISSNPADIVLVLDRSGSMSGSPLVNLKKGAKKFIEILDESTDSAHDGNIGMGSHIGIVSFSDNATKDTGLITSVALLDSAVDALVAGGSTNHADAFTKAFSLFDMSAKTQKIMVMFTDGETTAGAPPAPVAAAARAAGVVIYCIGLVGSTGIDVSALNDWATDPDSSHVAITPNDAQLEDLFQDLAANISKPGATDIVIEDIIHPDFIITSVLPPSKGTVNTINPTTLQWKIDKLGVKSNEGATLEFMVRHIASTSGTKEVNKMITYHDKEGNVVSFPSPKVSVSCNIVIYPEHCPQPVAVTIPACEDSAEYTVGDVYLESQGRILQVDVVIKNVCPKKRVAAAIIVTEEDCNGKEHKRGMKTVMVPAHTGDLCRDVLLRCVKFVLPEEIDCPCCKHHSLCSDRKFNVRVIANYMDYDFECCKQ